MRSYRTIAGPAEAEVIIKKSRFIGQAIPAACEEEAAAFVTQVKKKHREAAHNCHAWIIDPLNQRSNDDGEPSGTAGRPMLEVLRKEDLEHVAVVVTRYFGGILLGANGLVRAYGQACKAALEVAGMGRQHPFKKLTATVDYTLYGKLENQLRERQIKVLDTVFTDTVSVTLGLPLEQVRPVTDWLVDLSAAQAVLEPGEEYYFFIRGK